MTGQERVSEHVLNWFAAHFGYPISADQKSAIKLLNYIYPPKAKMLPAGKYWARQSDWPPGKAVIFDYNREFKAEANTEYHPIKNPFEESNEGRNPLR